MNIGTAAGVVTTITGNQTLGAIGVSGTFSSSSSLVLGAAGTTATVGTNNSNQTIDAVISGNANLLKVGNGTQFLRSLNPSFGGALEVNNGFTVLEFAQVAAASINIIPASTVVTLSGGGIQVLGHGTVGSTSNQTFTNAVVLKPGASSVGTAPRASQTTSLILTGGFNRQPGSTVNVLTNGGGASFIGNGVTPTSSITTNQSNADYTSGGGNQSILGGYAGFSSVVPTAAVLNPPTTWAVSANAASNTPITGLASFSSTFTAAANVDSALGNVSTGAAALTINSLRINNAGATTIDAAGGLNIASGGILVTAGVGNNPLSILNGALTSGNGTDLIVHQYAAGDLTIASQITGNIGLTKSGASRLILTNASNNYTGTTFVNTGVLRYGTSTTPGSTAALVHSGASIELTDGVTVTGQTATVSGTGVGANSVLFGANGNSTWAGNVVIGDIETRLGAANVATLNITGEISDGAPSNQVLNNKLWINGVTGTGAVVLSGTNTYTGTTAIIRGNLKLNSLNALPATTILDVHSGGNNVGLTTEQATIDLNGYSPTVSGLARTDTTGSGTITNFAAGTSTLTVNNPAANTFSGNIADGLGQVALVKSGAGSLTLSGSNTFSGGLIINNGTVTMGSQNAIGNQALPNALTLNGGLLNANSVAQISLAKLSGAAGTITDSGLAIGTTTLSTGSTTNEVFGGLIADGSVRNLSYIKGGSGTQSLTGANTYSGITVVTAGTLLVNNTTGSGTGTGTVVVSSGATLGGNGTIGTGLAGSTLRVNGTLAPGNSPGLLTSNQPVDFNIGSTFVVEANGSTLGSGYDQLVANSSVNISGTSVFQMTLGYAPALGDAFTFINLASGSIGGVFSNLPDNGFYTTTFAGNPYGFTTSYSGGTGNDLVLTTAVPEPGTIGILAAATLGLGLRRRRRQAGAVN